MKLYKRKIRKQKCKFKALYKVISEQHSLQLIPQIKKQVELELSKLLSSFRSLTKIFRLSKYE